MSLAKKIPVFVVFLLIFFTIALNDCFAQDLDGVKGFSVNPFFREINIEKDQAEAVIEVEIANNTENLAVLKLSVVDFGALDETGGVAFLGDFKYLENKYSLSSWISLEKDALVINSGEKQTVKVTIQNKESLSPGGHYAAILAKLDSGNNNSGEESAKISLDSSFSSLIFVRKIGGESYGMNLRDSEIMRNFFGLPGNVRLRFQNTGNIHVAPHGIVKLFDPFGREVSRGVINEESALVLPETLRGVSVKMRRMALTFVPGSYKMAINYRYDATADFVIQEQKIFIMPWVVVCIIPVVFIIVYVYFKIKKKRKK